MKSSQNLPEKLKEYRKKNHYSQEQVAEHMNLSRQAISNWETGKAYPDLDNLVMLSELYGTPVDVLLGEEVISDMNECTAIPSINNSILEMLGLAVVLILSLNIPFGGVVSSLIAVCWMNRTKRRYYVIYIIATIVFTFSLFDSIIIFVHFHDVYANRLFIPLK